MESNLQHEDLLIKLRSKLNEEKIKLWEPPFYQPEKEISSDLEELAKKYTTGITAPFEIILQALKELQNHSISRSKDNEEFKKSGLATLSVKITVAGEKPKIVKVQIKLEDLGSVLMSKVANEIHVDETRIKLIYSGKVLKPTPSLQEQGFKNGAQVMALVLGETPEEVKKEDTMYMEMKSTRDDALLLSESVDELGGDYYMKLEDQSGKTVELPASERRALMVALALQQRGCTAARQKRHELALLLLLEADRLFSECRSSILKQVDNWAVLQLDIAWCYLCLGSLQHATDAARRLRAAEEAFVATYGERNQRLIALKGTEANERVLFMRLYLLQGIVAYHQNKRDDAKTLLERAEVELNALRVDETAVTTLTELGWTQAEARSGLRATCGDLDSAHHYLQTIVEKKDAQRKENELIRERKRLGLCQDGSPVSTELITALMEMGFRRNVAIAALRATNNHASDAIRAIQEHPETLRVSESSSSSDSFQDVDEELVAVIVSMGYGVEDAKEALKRSNGEVDPAVDLLIAAQGKLKADVEESPSTSAGGSGPSKKRPRSHKKDKKKKEKEAALERLSSAIKTSDEDHLDTSLVQEEELLVQYKSLL